MENLDKIDVIRSRMNVNYEVAKRALDSRNWDVVEALVFLEQEERNRKEEFFVKGNELVDKVKEVVRKGNVTRIKVKQDDKVLIEIPVTAGVVGALVAPQLTVIGAVAALISRCTVEIERAETPPMSH
ncbi:MAG TPA: DUF4342 domain-containing protein [Bacillota bacterium]|nr:DUF4342 domain-containing protein [Bacillota bacterium]